MITTPEQTTQRRKRGDTRQRIRVTLGGDPTFDATGMVVLFKVRQTGDAGELVVNRAPDARSFAAGVGTTVELQPTEDDAFVSTAGTYHLEVEVTDPDGRVQTFPGGETGAPLYLTILTVPDLDDG